MPIRRRAVPAALVLACLAALAAAFLAPPGAGAASLVPKRGTVLTGVSDTGDVRDFLEFGELTGKHPAVLQTFHPWGNGLDIAYRRWQNAEVRPMLHISTADDETLAELITPKQIARGLGDAYLLQINSFFATTGTRAYIRPLGEPNRCLNAWSAVNCDGSKKGGEHKPYWYKLAFKRIALIVRGGLPADRLDAKLNHFGMPGVAYGALPRPAALPAPPVAIVWSPLPAGSPKVKGNWPGNYWPGRNFVDWAGTDFYSDYPHWNDLNKFFRGKPWRSKPIALTEWAVAGSDGKTFTRKLFAWMEKRPRVRMYSYYVGFGTAGNPYDPVLYPQATRVLRNKLRNPRYLEWAPGHLVKPATPTPPRDPAR